MDDMITDAPEVSNPCMTATEPINGPRPAQSATIEPSDANPDDQNPRISAPRSQRDLNRNAEGCGLPVICRVFDPEGTVFNLDAWGKVRRSTSSRDHSPSGLAGSSRDKKTKLVWPQPPRSRTLVDRLRRNGSVFSSNVAGKSQGRMETRREDMKAVHDALIEQYDKQPRYDYIKGNILRDGSHGIMPDNDGDARQAHREILRESRANSPSRSQNRDGFSGYGRITTRYGSSTSSSRNNRAVSLGPSSTRSGLSPSSQSLPGASDTVLNDPSRRRWGIARDQNLFPEPPRKSSGVHVDEPHDSPSGDLNARAQKTNLNSFRRNVFSIPTFSRQRGYDNKTSSKDTAADTPSSSNNNKAGNNVSTNSTPRNLHTSDKTSKKGTGNDQDGFSSDGGGDDDKPKRSRSSERPHYLDAPQPPKRSRSQVSDSDSSDDENTSRPEDNVRIIHNNGAGSTSENSTVHHNGSKDVNDSPKLKDQPRFARPLSGFASPVNAMGNANNSNATNETNNLKSLGRTSTSSRFVELLDDKDANELKRKGQVVTHHHPDGHVEVGGAMNKGNSAVDALRKSVQVEDEPATNKGNNAVDALRKSVQVEDGPAARGEEMMWQYELIKAITNLSVSGLDGVKGLSLISSPEPSSRRARVRVDPGRYSYQVERGHYIVRDENGVAVAATPGYWDSLDENEDEDDDEDEDKGEGGDDGEGDGEDKVEDNDEDEDEDEGLYDEGPQM